MTVSSQLSGGHKLHAASCKQKLQRVLNLIFDPLFKHSTHNTKHPADFIFSCAISKRIFQLLFFQHIPQW